MVLIRKGELFRRGLGSDYTDNRELNGLVDRSIDWSAGIFILCKFIDQETSLNC